MNKRQASRLLNVAKALREREDPKLFDMSLYVYVVGDWCGSPACALGTFASRSDLQRLLTIGRMSRNPYHPVTMVFRSDTQHSAHYDSEEVMDYFGITFGEADELFSIHGCGRAKTAIAAAKYIEDFVARSR